MKKLAERIIGEVNSDLITAIRKGEEVLGRNHASLDGMSSSELNEYLNDLRIKYQEKEHKPSSTAEIPQDDVKNVETNKIVGKETEPEVDKEFEQAVKAIEKAIKAGNVPNSPLTLSGYPEVINDFAKVAKNWIAQARTWQQKAEKNEMAKKIFYPAKRDRVIALSEVMKNAKKDEDADNRA